MVTPDPKRVARGLWWDRAWLTDAERFSGKIRLMHDDLEKPFRVRKPTVWAARNDLFHEDVPDEFLDKAFAVMALAERHDFLVLTKRPERLLKYMHNRDWSEAANWAHDKFHRRLDGPMYLAGEIVPPLPNVWLGTSVENQATANERTPWLVQCPAALRFLSIEPLLEAVDLTQVAWTLPSGGVVQGSVLGDTDGQSFSPRARGRGIHWVIIGCESGSNCRPCKLEWVKSLIDDCDAAGLHVFVKQLNINGRVSKDPAEWPEWARRREFPENKESES